MTDDIKAIREALDSCITDKIKRETYQEALAALDRIEAQKPEPTKDARELGALISSIFGVSRPQCSGDPGNDPALDRVTAEIERFVAARLARAPSPAENDELQDTIKRVRYYIGERLAGFVFSKKGELTEDAELAKLSRLLTSRAPSPSGAGAILEGLRIDLNSLAIGGMMPVWYESKARALLERLDALLSSPSSGALPPPKAHCSSCRYNVRDQYDDICDQCDAAFARYQPAESPSGAGEAKP